MVVAKQNWSVAYTTFVLETLKSSGLLNARNGTAEMQILFLGHNVGE